jgi:hypothetical protein
MVKDFSIIFGILLCAGIPVHAQYSPDKMQKLATSRRFEYIQDTLYAFFAVMPSHPIKIELKKTYYWFRQDSIFITQGGYAGRLLDGAYQVFYPCKQLMESGAFRLGLKVGVWKRWYPNGALQCVSRWRRGQQRGLTQEYAQDGVIISGGEKKIRPDKRRRKSHKRKSEKQPNPQ